MYNHYGTYHAQRIKRTLMIPSFFPKRVDTSHPYGIQCEPARSQVAVPTIYIVLYGSTSNRAEKVRNIMATAWSTVFAPSCGKCTALQVLSYRHGVVYGNSMFLAQRTPASQQRQEADHTPEYQECVPCWEKGGEPLTWTRFGLSLTRRWSMRTVAPSFHVCPWQ